MNGRVTHRSSRGSRSAYGGSRHTRGGANKRRYNSSSNALTSSYAAQHHHHHANSGAAGAAAAAAAAAAGGYHHRPGGVMLAAHHGGSHGTHLGGHLGVGAGRRPPRVTPIKHKKHDVKVKRLNLDEALKTANDGQIGWSEARKYAWKQLEKNPESYYYRFNAPGQKQKTGHWTEEEERAFMRRLAEVGPQKWGLFSMAINGRNGLSCSGYYRKLLLANKVKDDNYIIDKDNKLRYVASRSAKYRRKFIDPKKFSYNYEDYFEVTGTGPCSSASGSGAPRPGQSRHHPDDSDILNEEDPEVLFDMLHKLDPNLSKDDYVLGPMGEWDVDALRDDIAIGRRRKHAGQGSPPGRGRKRGRSTTLHAGATSSASAHSNAVARRNKRRVSSGNGAAAAGKYQRAQQQQQQTGLYDDGLRDMHDESDGDESGAHTESDDNCDPLALLSPGGGVAAGGHGGAADADDHDYDGSEDDEDESYTRIMFKPLPMLPGYQNLPEFMRRFDLRYFDCCQNIEPFPEEEYAALVKKFLNERHHRVRRNLRRTSNRNRGESVLPPLIEQHPVLQERLQLLRSSPHLVTAHMHASAAANAATAATAAQQHTTSINAVMRSPAVAAGLNGQQRALNTTASSSSSSSGVLSTGAGSPLRQPLVSSIPRSPASASLPPPPPPPPLSPQQQQQLQHTTVPGSPASRTSQQSLPTSPAHTSALLSSNSPSLTNSRSPLSPAPSSALSPSLSALASPPSPALSPSVAPLSLPPATAPHDGHGSRAGAPAATSSVPPHAAAASSDHAARVLMLVYLRMLDYYVRLNPYAQAPLSAPWLRQSTREVMDTVHVFSQLVPTNQKERDAAASTTPQATLRQHSALFKPDIVQSLAAAASVPLSGTTSLFAPQVPTSTVFEALPRNAYMMSPPHLSALTPPMGVPSVSHFAPALGMPPSPYLHAQQQQQQQQPAHSGGGGGVAAVNAMQMPQLGATMAAGMADAGGAHGHFAALPAMSTASNDGLPGSPLSLPTPAPLPLAPLPSPALGSSASGSGNSPTNLNGAHGSNAHAQNMAHSTASGSAAASTLRHSPGQSSPASSPLPAAQAHAHLPQHPHAMLPPLPYAAPHEQLHSVQQQQLQPSSFFQAPENATKSPPGGQQVQPMQELPVPVSL